MVLSLGSYGCNLCCPFCQNASIAQVAGGRIPTMPAAPCSTDSLEKSLPGYEVIAPGKLVDLALQMRSRGNIGLAYTYNEPLVGYEYVRDCATLAHQNDLLNVLVTNGYINARPWQELLPLIDAVNIDLKGFTQDFYDRVCAPHGLQTVKRSIELAAATGTCHLEVTTLVISGINDSPAEIAALAAWLASVDPGIPLHITRFFPTYLMTDRPATPRKTIIDLVKVAQQHLQTVLPGNI
jgi:pyruvate formate lyase activating enzyme